MPPLSCPHSSFPCIPSLFPPFLSSPHSPISWQILVVWTYQRLNSMPFIRPILLLNEICLNQTLCTWILMEPCCLKCSFSTSGVLLWLTTSSHSAGLLHISSRVFLCKSRWSEDTSYAGLCLGIMCRQYKLSYYQRPLHNPFINPTASNIFKPDLSQTHISSAFIQVIAPSCQSPCLVPVKEKWDLTKSAIWASNSQSNSWCKVSLNCIDLGSCVYYAMPWAYDNAITINKY